MHYIYLSKYIEPSTYSFGSVFLFVLDLYLINALSATPSWCPLDIWQWEETEGPVCHS